MTEDHDELVGMRGRLAALEAAISAIRVEYVRLERYLHIERIVLGAAAIVGTGLLGLAITRLF